MVQDIITGEDIQAKVEEYLQEAGLDGEVGFMLWDRRDFDVVYTTPDIFVIARIPSKESPHVQIPILKDK